jgi:hypothetical protein
MGLGSGIRVPGSEIGKKPILYPGARIQGSKKPRIPDPDPQHWFLAGEWNLGGPRHKIIFSSRTHSQLSQAMGELAGMPICTEDWFEPSVIDFINIFGGDSVHFCDFSLGMESLTYPHSILLAVAQRIYHP